MRSAVVLYGAFLVGVNCVPTINGRDELDAVKPKGTGPYPAVYTTDPSLLNHTIYAPASIPSGLKLPVLVWGETGCTHNGLVFQAFLTEVASYGVFIIAAGEPNGPNNPDGIAATEHPDGTPLKQAVDWIVTDKGAKYPAVDASRIAVAGQSCGGTQTYMLSQDPRVSVLGIFNSGLINATDPLPTKLTKPIFYFLGGPTDIAYKNGERDYTVLPATTPKWKGNMAVGHMGTYFQANGGLFGVAAVRWVQWMLRGNTTASAFFTGSGAGTARGDGWTVEAAALDSIKVTSLD